MADSRNMTSKRAKCRYYCRIFLTHLFSHVGLCALVVGYAIVGAITFQHLESNPHSDAPDPVPADREKCLKDLWNLTKTLNVLYERNWTLLVGNRLMLFEEEIVNATKSERQHDGTAGSEWSFSGALLYCITVITTIGYGNIAPKTDVGKVVTIFYALFGIPLMLLCLTNIGDVLARTFKFTYSHFCLLCSNRRRHHSQKQQRIEENNKIAAMFEKVIPDATSIDLCPNDEKKSVVSDGSSPTSSPPSNKSMTGNNSVVVIHEPNPVVIERVYSARSRSLPQSAIDVDDNDERVPMYMVLILVTSYICGGAALFSLWEKWTFLDGAYFCFITLSTIGFGDLVPGSNILDIDSGQAKLIICCFYLILGLAIIAMSFNLVQEEVIIKCKNLARNLGFLDSDNEDDDD